MTVRHVARAAALAIALPCGAASAQSGACGQVTITEMNWASGAVVTAVAAFLMEQGYGCDVSKVPSSTSPAITSVAETGQPDVLTELWTNASPVYDRLKEEGKVQPLANVITGADEGFWVPDYLVEEHPELATIEGVVAHPEWLGGRIHQCPDGWDCKTVNANIIAGAGLEEAGYEIFQHGSGETMATSMAAAYQDHEPWIGYYWSPNAVLGKYPMVLVDMGEFDPEAHACNSREDCENPRVNPYPESTVLTVVTSDFAEAHPEVTEFLSHMSFTADQMNALLAWQDENTASPDETAVHFLTTYEDTWSGWLNDSARDKLSNLLQ